jgi:hypothetical protein
MNKGVGSIDHFVLEEDALLVILAINSRELFSLWNFYNLVFHIILSLYSFQIWNALKVSRCANYRAHALAKCVASHLVFKSISTGSHILSSIRIKSGKDHLLQPFFPTQFDKKRKEKKRFSPKSSSIELWLLICWYNFWSSDVSSWNMFSLQPTRQNDLNKWACRVCRWCLTPMPKSDSCRQKYGECESIGKSNIIDT